jgi:cobalt-zinc-cadmium efflux system protein
MVHAHNRHDYNRAFGFGVMLNVAFVVIEVVYGVAAGSLALIADAAHNLSDVASLLLAWGASALAARSATSRRTYGFRKATVLASLVSAILLLAAMGGIAWEAVGRFRQPAPVDSKTVIVVAAIGVVINTLTALLFVKGQREDLNIRGAFLHMAADAAVSLGVVVAGVLIAIGGWLWLDPTVSLLVVGVVVVGTWGLLRDSLDYTLDAVPKGIDYDAVRQFLLGIDRVTRIHDLHVWPLSTTDVALTVHVEVGDDELDNRFLLGVQEELHRRFGIEHATIQVEAASDEAVCLLDHDRCQRTGRLGKA